MSLKQDQYLEPRLVEGAGRSDAFGPGERSSARTVLMRLDGLWKTWSAATQTWGEAAVRFGVAIASAVAATVLKLGIDALIGPNDQSTVVFPAAIIVAAWRGGLWPGLVCTLLSLVSVDYFFSAPYRQWLGNTPATNVNLLFFAADGLLISLICDALGRARSRAAAHDAQAQDALRSAQRAAHDAQQARSISDATKQRFQRLFDSNIIAIFIAERDGRILEANDAFLRIAGCRQADMADGQCNWRRMTPPEAAQRDDEALREIGRTGVCQPYEKEFLRADGARVPVLLGCAEADNEGRLICFAVDLTEQRAVTKRLAKAMSAVEAGSRAKSEFVANISHELRTPMNAILGMTELALGDDLTPRTRGFLETAKASADALLNLLNDLLDFSRLETGQFSLRPQPFRMTEVCDGAVRTLSLRAQEKNLFLAWNVVPDVPEWLLGDAVRLRQIIVNLVGNAIKFTERGNVRLAVELVENKDAIAQLRLTVADTGIGIAPEDQQRIFEAFTQVDASATRRFSGTGLGLSITRQLVLQMGGRISVESAPDHGTVFTCLIPLPLCDGAEDEADKLRRSPARLRSARPLHVLVGEDTPANQLLVAAILERYGHSCEVACDGEQLLSILSQRPFDAILLDVQMPRKDGLQTAAEIRALKNARLAAIPIVAMTAHALDSDRERCLAAGMTDYISKPLSARKLIDILESAVGAHPALPPRAAPVAAAHPTPKPAGPPMQCFNYEESLQRLGGDRELFCSLAKCFVEDSDGLLAEVAAGNHADEANRVERAAHSLKGLAATFSAAAVVSRAQFIEHCARQGDLSRVRALLPDLGSETEKLKTALQPYASEAT